MNEHIANLIRSTSNTSPILFRTGITDRFQIGSDNSFTFIGSGSQSYKISLLSDGIQLQGQTSGLYAFVNLFTKDGDGTDDIGWSIFGRGNPTFSGPSELMECAWRASESAYVLETFAFGGGANRPIKIRTPGNTDQLLINTDGSLTHSGAPGQQAFVISRRGTRNIALQGQNSGEAAYLTIHTRDGDGTDNVGILLVGVGTPGVTTNNEFLEFNYSQANGFYQIVPQASGTGIKRPLTLYTQQSGGTFNTNQIRLNIDGSVDFTGPGNTNPYRWLVNGAGVMTLQRTNAGPARLDVFTQPGDGTQPSSLGVYAVGLPNATSNSELFRLQWTASKFRIATIASGTGTLRPFSLEVGNSNPDQIRLNTDSSVDFGGPSGTNPYRWLVDGNGVMTLRRTTAGRAGLDIYTQLGDGTQNSTLTIYAVGLPNSSPSEFLRLGWDSANFRIFTNTGGGTLRPLILEVGDTHPNQIRLNTDSSVVFGGPSGDNPYRWLISAASMMTLQRTTHGQSGLELYPGLLGGDSISLNIYAVGLPNAVTNSELLQVQWYATRFRIATVANGTGVNRPLSLEATNSNPNQLRLNVDGSVSLGHPTTAHLLWNTDGGGDIGLISGSRPGSVHIVSTLTIDGKSFEVTRNRVNTTDDTVTTLHTIATVNNSAVFVEARIVARRTGGTAGTANDAAYFVIRARIKNSGGTVTLHDVISEESKDQAGWDADLDVSGTDVRVRVTGATDNNITWDTTVFTQRV